MADQEQRQRVVQLKQELEKERSAKKQLHHDKVRELKAAKEKEQAAARGQIEALRMKLQREKNQELQSLRDSMTKDFKGQLRAVQKKHDEAMQKVQKDWKKERQDLREKLKGELQTQLQEEWSSRLVSERKKLTQELFELEARCRASESTLQEAVAADRNKADAIREMSNQHRSEVEAIQRAARLSSKQMLEELEEGQRKLQQRDRELSQLSERLSRAQADQEQTEEELKRMKRAESWSRRTPTLSPSSSSDELSAPAAKPYSRRERDMLVRNSELSFHVRRLEEANGTLAEQNKDLKEKLQVSESQQRPLKEQTLKLSQRINNLNSALRSQEKQVKQLAQENLDLKTAKQHLEEEHGQQRKNLMRQLSMGSIHRTEKEKLNYKNRELAEANANLYTKVEELEHLNASLQERISLPTSPTSPSLQSDDEFGSQLSLWSEGGGSFQHQFDQMEFEREEMKAKYDEIKSEYMSIREKYRDLREKYERLQSKGREQQATHRQVQGSYELLKQEKLGLEREVSLLRMSGRDSPYDLERQQALLQTTQEQLRGAESRVQELEEFIIEQDRVSRAKESAWLEERMRLLVDQKEEEEAGEGDGGDERQKEEEGVGVLNSRIAELEEANSELTRAFKQAQAQHEDDEQLVSQLEEENAGLASEMEELELHQSELEERLRYATKSEDSGRVESEEGGDSIGFDEPDVRLDSPLSMSQFQQWVDHYQSERRALRSENQELHSHQAEALQRVAELQGLVGELEGRLTEEEEVHLSAISHNDEEIAHLTTQLSQQERKLTRLRRAITVGINQQMSLQLGHKVLSCIARVKGAMVAMETDSLLEELQSLEDAVNELLQTLFPGDFELATPLPVTTSTSLPISVTAPLLVPPSAPPPITSSTPLPVTTSTSLPVTSSGPLPVTSSTHLPVTSSTPLPVTTSTATASTSPPITPSVLLPVTSSSPVSTTPHEEEEEQPLEPPPPVPTSPPTCTPPPESPPPESPPPESPPPESPPLESPPPESPPPESPPPESPPPESPPPESPPPIALPPPSPPLEPPPIALPSPHTPPLEPAPPVPASPPTPSVDSIPPVPVSPATPPLEPPPPVLPSPPTPPLEPPPPVPLSPPTPPLEPPPPVPLSPPTPPLEPPPPVPLSPPIRPLESVSTFPSSLPTSRLDGLPTHPLYMEQIRFEPTLEAIPPLLTEAKSASYVSTVPGYQRPTATHEEPSCVQDPPVYSRRTASTDDVHIAPSDTRVFVAVMDYDPTSLCTTGRPDLELTLQTGAVIAVHGAMDSNGYYTATFEGCTGLVPANFVQEVEVTNEDSRQRLFNQTLGSSYSHSSLTPSRADTLKPAGHTSPSPPSDFHVDKSLVHSTLLVCWQPPPCDEGGRSNGCLVTGYQLYVNNQPTTMVTGAAQNGHLLPGLDLSETITLGISTCSQGGPSSEIVTITYPEQPLMYGGRLAEMEPFRMFVALYDYDPQKSSPSANPEFELCLKEGNLVKVFGMEMPDGFLMGEVGGSRGLVPASFVSEVSGWHDAKHTSLKATEDLAKILPANSKKMVAIYNYTPQKDSPNPNPGMELSFKTGDVITVYGQMDDDGFYTGELGGQFGLVPSNLLEEEVMKATPSPPSAPSPPSMPSPPSPPSPPSQLHTSTRDTELTDSHDAATVEGAGGREKEREAGWEEDKEEEHLPGGEAQEKQDPKTEEDSSDKKEKDKKQKRGFTFSKEWVKLTFTRKRTGSGPSVNTY